MFVAVALTQHRAQAALLCISKQTLLLLMTRYKCCYGYDIKGIEKNYFWLIDNENILTYQTS